MPPTAETGPRVRGTRGPVVFISVPASLAVSSIANCGGSQKPLFMFMADTTWLATMSPPEYPETTTANTAVSSKGAARYRAVRRLTAAVRLAGRASL